MRQHELYDRAVYQYSIKTSISCLNNIHYFCLQNPYRLIFNDHNARISDCGNRSLNPNVDFLITDSNILIQKLGFTALILHRRVSNIKHYPII